MKETLYEQIKEFGTKKSSGAYFEVYRYKYALVTVMFTDKEHKTIERIYID